jgi:hypothetical protein
MRFSMPGMPMKTIPALALVEDRSQLFEAVHLQPVGFVDGMSVVGSGTAFFRASYSSKVWK